MAAQVIRKKIVLVGDKKTGKTAFVKKIKTGEFEPVYVATLGVEVQPVQMDDYLLNIWDCAGDERFMGIADGYYIKAEGAIIMLQDYESALIAKEYADKITEVAGEIPMVFVGNKADQDQLPNDFASGDYPYLKLSTRDDTREDLKSALQALIGHFDDESDPVEHEIPIAD